MATVTLRLDDETRTEIEARARGRGETVSDLLRAAIDQFLGREGASMPNRAPRTLTLGERSVLAAQHEILSVTSEDDEESQRHLTIVEILMNGFSGEYETVFAGFDAEISPRECKLVWKLFEMFRVLSASVHRLDAEAKADIGDDAEYALSFQGFDVNDARESGLARYARFVVRTGRWQEHKAAFDGGGGNAPAPMLAVYQRMLTAFESIWDQRSSDGSLSVNERMFLDHAELKSVYAGRGRA
jgi:uncharacterized protein YfbU (UPF0304 family)